MNKKFYLVLKTAIVIILTSNLACKKSKENTEVVKIEKEEAQDDDSQDQNQSGHNNDGEWNLIFEEEFSDNFDKWNVWRGGAFNNEIQLYTQEQMRIENGILTINAEKKTVTGASNPFDPAIKEFQYVSGRIESKQQFGPSDRKGENEYRIMSRIKLPSGNGIWPAFWTYSDPWPTKGEIDILEARGNQKTRFQSNIFYGTEVNTSLTKNDDTSKSHELNMNLTSDFHVYELIWKTDSLEILFDNQLLHTYTADNKNYIAELFGDKHQIVLNLAVGGGFFEGVDANTFVNTSSMEVDWVKIYKR